MQSLAFLSAALGLAGGAAGSLALSRFQSRSTRRPALADLLPWAVLADDGVVLLKDGSLLRAYRMSGPDATSTTLADRALLAEHLNDALLPLTDSWLLHCDLVRRPADGYAPPGHFPDAVSRAIDAERRDSYLAAGSLFENETILTLTYQPPRASQQRLMRAFVSTSDPHDVEPWDRLLSGFLATSDELAARLATALRARPLTTGELLSHLHLCLTGLFHAIEPPADDAPVDCYLADCDLLAGWRPQVGANHLRVIAIHAWPPVTSPGLLDALARLKASYRISHRFQPLGTSAADRLLRERLGMWFRTRRGMRAWAREVARGNAGASTREQSEDELFFDQHARDMAADAAAARSFNAAGTTRFGFYTLSLVLTGPDRTSLDQAVLEAVKCLTDAGFPSRVETINAIEAWFATMPGDGTSNVRRVLLNSRNVADLLPLTRIWTGSPANPSPLFPEASPALLWATTSGAAGAEPFRLNLHHDDVGHALVVGPTGAGKSVLVGLLALQFLRYAASRVVHFDVGGSAYLPARAAGALHYDLASPSRPVHLQPLRYIDDRTEFIWALDWLELLLALQGHRVESTGRAALKRAMELLAAKPDPAERSLTDLSIHLGSSELSRALTPYTLDGALAALLSSREEHLSTSRYQVFELQTVMGLGDSALVPVLTYLFHAIERSLAGAPTLLIIEEAWLPLLNTLFAKKVRDWLLTARKRNCAVVLVTQSLAQLASAGDSHVLFDSAPTRILLPNADAGSSANAPLYRDLGLSDHEIALVARAQRKRDYYFVGPAGRRLFQLGLGPAALAFLTPAEGLTTSATNELVDSFIDRYGAAWTAEWLRHRGLAAEAAQLHLEIGG